MKQFARVASNAQSNPSRRKETLRTKIFITAVLAVQTINAHHFGFEISGGSAKVNVNGKKKKTERSRRGRRGNQRH
jgi:hypothetical protein